MNLIKNIRFYWDNISRFESNQLYYLIIHRIKARFSGLIKYDIFRSIPGNFLITRDTFKTRINTIIRMQSGRSIWDLTETDNIQEIQYFRELKSQIQRNLNSPEKLWLIELEDSEVANNYDRFHLFAEAFVALQLTST